MGENRNSLPGNVLFLERGKGGILEQCGVAPTLLGGRARGHLLIGVTLSSPVTEPGKTPPLLPVVGAVSHVEPVAASIDFTLHGVIRRVEDSNR